MSSIDKDLLMHGLMGWMSSMINIQHLNAEKTMCSITMPIFMADGDSIEVYIEQDKNENGFILSDDGETFGVHIGKYGCKPLEGKKKEKIAKRLHTSNCDFDGETISMRVRSEEDLPRMIFYFAHTISVLTHEETHY